MRDNTEGTVKIFCWDIHSSEKRQGTSGAWNERWCNPKHLLFCWNCPENFPCSSGERQYAFSLCLGRGGEWLERYFAAWNVGVISLGKPPALWRIFRGRYDLEAVHPPCLVSEMLESGGTWRNWFVLLPRLPDGSVFQSVWRKEDLVPGIDVCLYAGGWNQKSPEKM